MSLGEEWVEIVLGIYGAGGFGREVLETAYGVNQVEHKYTDFKFIIDEKWYEPGKRVQGVETTTLEDFAARYASDGEVILGIGEPRYRIDMIERIKTKNLKLATIIHPSVEIPVSTSIGQGSYIGFGCFVSCNTQIGECIVAQPLAGIGHDCVIGDNVIVSGHVSLGGHIFVGDNTFIAMNAALAQDIKVGKDCVISMGSMVYGDIADGLIAAGNPARPMKRNENSIIFKEKA